MILAFGGGIPGRAGRSDTGTMATASARRDEHPTAPTRLLSAGGILAGGAGLSALFAATGVGLVCPFLALTGWQCPLCGGTRMGAALLRGDVTAAIAANPVALLAVGVLGLVAVAAAIELMGGPVLRPPRRLGEVVRRVPAPVWLVLGALAAVAYTVLRNQG